MQCEPINKNKMAEVKYPIGIQTFEKIREGGYIYADKTKYIYQLAHGGQYYFIARPRRFGKSLMLSTLKAYFEGKKELFQGLAMESLEKDWVEYPVIMISLAAFNKDEDQSLENILNEQFSELEKVYHIDDTPTNLSMRFRRLIREAKEKTGRKVVVLIDEYDAPIVENIGDDKKMDSMRNALKSVYSNLKDMDAYIHFAMLTGVSRFSKMTIFSGLNNIDDISFYSKYSEICGITESELESNFHDGITRLAEAYDTDYAGALAALKTNYDGYHFTKDSPDIYNPFSLLQALDKSEIDAYWFRSGTPTFLIRLLGKDNRPLSEIMSTRATEAIIADIDTYRSSPLALLFQTGYLTIKSYDPIRRRYTLGIPNKEVETGLFTELLAFNTDMDKFRLQMSLMDIRDAFEDGEPDKALGLIKSFFASIPAIITQQNKELYYENNLYMLLHILGLDVCAEWWTSDGRIDLLVLTPDYVYVMELKLNGTPQEAMAQIDSKDYTLQWQHDGRHIFKIGVAFSTDSRNLANWIIR